MLTTQPVPLQDKIIVLSFNLNSSKYGIGITENIRPLAEASLSSLYASVAVQIRLKVPCRQELNVCKQRFA